MKDNNTTTAGITLNGREVDLRSIYIDGVNPSDYPDFCDAFIAEAQWVDGEMLNDAELEQLTQENGDLVNEMAHEQVF